MFRSSSSDQVSRERLPPDDAHGRTGQIFVEAQILALRSESGIARLPTEKANIKDVASEWHTCSWTSNHISGRFSNGLRQNTTCFTSGLCAIYPRPSTLAAVYIAWRRKVHQILDHHLALGASFRVRLQPSSRNDSASKY